jgi:hypothetical protein
MKVEIVYPLTLGGTVRGAREKLNLGVEEAGRLAEIGAVRLLEGAPEPEAPEPPVTDPPEVTPEPPHPPHVGRRQRRSPET